MITFAKIAPASGSMNLFISPSVNEAIKVPHRFPTPPKTTTINESTGLSNEAFVSELKSKIPIIEYYQNLIDNNIINKAFDFVGMVTGNQDFINYNIKHKSALDPIIKDQIKETVITNQITNDQNGDISK